VPFTVYTAANTGAYKVGVYGGLQILYIPGRGFDHILIDVNVTDLLTQ
jgi:hypothetical protein